MVRNSHLARSTIWKPECHFLQDGLSVLTGPQAARGALRRVPGRVRVGTWEQAPPWASAWPTAPSRRGHPQLVVLALTPGRQEPVRGIRALGC